MRSTHAGRLAIVLAAIVLGPGPAAAQTTSGPKTYQARQIRIDHLVGTLNIEAVESGAIEVVLDGRADMLKDISVGVKDDVLVLRRSRSLLDWPPEDLFKWRDNYPTVTLRAPSGTALDIEGMIGRATVGDLKAPLRLDTSSLDTEIGDVTDASIRLSGMGDARIGRVQGALEIEISGSGNLAVGAAQSLEISVSGSGDVAVGPVERGAAFMISGSGNIAIDEVHGPVDGRINGSGKVSIGGGTAEPLRLRVNGSGDFTFDGEAVDPDLAVNGSGKIRLGSYRGTIRLRTFTGTLRPIQGGGILIEQ